MHPRRIALLIALALVLGGVGFAGYQHNGLALQAWLQGSSPSVAPAGQRPFEVLASGSFHDLRDAFNAQAGKTRILALLSPA